MTKPDAIKKIYGDNPTFIYDTALPQPVLDNIAKEAAAGYPEDMKDTVRSRVYRTILYGCVYAYDRHGTASGFLPITSAARLELQLSKYAGAIYVPTLETLEDPDP